MKTVFVLIAATWEMCGLRYPEPCLKIYQRGIYENALQCRKAEKGSTMTENARGNPKTTYQCQEVIGDSNDK